jgi:hypothetical protein
LGIDIVIVYDLLQLFVLINIFNNLHGVFASWTVYQQRHLICIGVFCKKKLTHSSKDEVVFDDHSYCHCPVDHSEA